MFYFKQTHEFIFASRLYTCDCKVYLLRFNSNFTLKNKSFIDPVNDTITCSQSNSSSVYFNEGFYYVVSDNKSGPKIVFKKAKELGNTEIVEEPITYYNIYNITIQENNTEEKHEEVKGEDNNDIEDNYNEENKNKKCKNSTEESIIYDLCISCNTENGFFPAETKDNSLFYGFVECYNNNTKPINFYFNSSINKYKICYETCLTCNEGGDEYNNNCLLCDIDHIKKPDFPNSKNCVTKCIYLYYYTSYGQYKCTKDNNCPEEENLYIKELKKFTNDCSKEKKYKYQYGGSCLEKCPENTIPNSKNICLAENNHL